MCEICHDFTPELYEMNLDTNIYTKALNAHCSLIISSNKSTYLT